jgi:hypothetical protein
MKNVMDEMPNAMRYVICAMLVDGFEPIVGNAFDIDAVEMLGDTSRRCHSCDTFPSLQEDPKRKVWCG